MTYGIGSWSEDLGNHRAVLRVDKPTAAVWAHIPWRRRDEHPELKAIWVTDAQNTRIRNVLAASVQREYGDIVFQPAAGPGEYFVYYLPHKHEGWWASPAVEYAVPESSADGEWLRQNGLAPEPLSRQTWRQLPHAVVIEIQAINEFHRFDPMEVPATAQEMDAFLKRHGDRPYLLFPEDRRYPIRMLDELPLRWLESGPSTHVHGEARLGEFYAFQIGVYALGARLEALQVAFGDLRSANRYTIPAASLRCVNLSGTDWLGRPMTKRVSVPAAKVQALWCGVQVPDDARPGRYSGKMVITAENAPPSEVTVDLTVSNKTIAAAGDHDLWRHSRLRWLDSTIGLDDEVFPPYTAVRVSDDSHEATVLGRRVRVGQDALPVSIVSTFGESVDTADAPAREMLAGPVRFVAETAGRELGWQDDGCQVVQRTSGAVVWEAVSRAQDGLSRHCRAKIECDGYLDYRLTIRSEKARTFTNISLEIPLRRDVARFMLGLGRKGGPRPTAWDWTWSAQRSNHHIWLGDVNAGLQCKLKHVTPHWALYGIGDTGLYRDWSGQGQGGCSLREQGDSVVFRAFTGPCSVETGQELHFNFGLLITPVKTLDKAHWRWRYFHQSRSRPVKDIAGTGAALINLHQGDHVNPHINYPFATADKLAAYVHEAHEAGMKVKIYYTVRELSNYTTELWALRSLGSEIFRDGPGFKLADHFRTRKADAARPRTGSSWLCEHLISNYAPAWHQPLGNGHYDAALAQQGLSRWHNYYLEGLNYLIQHVGIDGLYLDGIGYDREIMKRVRKVMQRAKPGCLIDFHSGNNFHPNYGQNNVAGQYMELFPCIDSLWFGEGFDYDESPDYWLVEIAGIPFGLFGEMLQGGGNPWRGMLYGMTNRLGWGGEPRALWKLWDEFGIEPARMSGYWDSACPVRTGRTDVLATAYVRREQPAKTLVALASWAPEVTTCRLDVDWDTLRLSPERARFYAPPLENFQPAALFQPDADIPLHPGRGWLLILDEQPHDVPSPDAHNPFAGRTLLLEDKFGGTTLAERWQVRLSTRPDTALRVAAGAVRITAAANSVAFAERPLPPDVGLVSCRIDPQTDHGATWGPGIALVWADGRSLRVNLRAESRFGVYGYKGETLGGRRFAGESYTLLLQVGDEHIAAKASSDGHLWQTLANVPRDAFPGSPSAVRVGKMGIPSHTTDYHIPGPDGTCEIRHAQAFSRRADPPH